MRTVVQRVSRASVTVEGRIVGQIGSGLLVLVGVAGGDTVADVEYMATKILGLRIFGDDEGRMNRSVLDMEGALLLVSQFTLMGDARKGRRPAFDGAAPPADAKTLFDDLVMRLRQHCAVETGIFQAHMDVALVNDGPVTVLLDSRRLF